MPLHFYVMKLFEMKALSWIVGEGASRHSCHTWSVALELRKILNANWFALETSGIISPADRFLHSVKEKWDFQAQYWVKWLIWMGSRRGAEEEIGEMEWKNKAAEKR